LNWPLREPYEGTVYVLGAVGLGPFTGRQIAGLSGGQRQRIAITRMLARQVECVIADEPTANLDPALTAETMSLFRHLAAHVPVIIITHDPAVAAACDRTVVLQSAVTAPASTTAPAPAWRPRRVPLPLAASIAVGVLAIAGTIAAIIIPAPGQSPGGRAARTVVLRPGSPAVHAHRSPPPSPSPSISAVASQPPAAATSPPLPVLTAGDWTGTDPSTVDFSGDGGNVVTGITWSSWTATGARGRGTSYLDNCVPNCAEGYTVAVPAEIYLSVPVNGQFTVMRERRAGATSAWTYPVPWPLGAS
jgi:energy-coupling factor transporter ATP-binding protein EcfA2